MTILVSLLHLEANPTLKTIYSKPKRKWNSHSTIKSEQQGILNTLLKTLLQSPSILSSFISSKNISNTRHSNSAFRYTILTWAPKSLFMQFKRAANIYFLVITVLTALPFSPKVQNYSIPKYLLGRTSYDWHICICSYFYNVQRGLWSTA